MIDLALANPAFRPTIKMALIGMPAAILLVEFAGDDKQGLLPRLSELDELMGALALPGSVVEMAGDRPQKDLWEVRKAGLNIMMAIRGDGKPISFIEDCAVPLEHLADYTDALTEVFARRRHPRHLVRPCLSRHFARAPDPRPASGRAAGRRPQDARDRRRGRRAGAQLPGAYSGEHGDGLCRGEWIAWQFGPAITEAFRAIKQKLDPIGLFNPGKIIDPPDMDDGTLLRFASPGTPRPYQVIALQPKLDWSAWDVRNDPITEAITPPGTGGDVTGGFAKAARCATTTAIAASSMPGPCARAIA